MNIEFGKIVDLLKFNNQFINQQEQVFILDSHYVESSIVLYQLEKTILFLDKEDQHSYRRPEILYLLHVKILSDKCIQF